MSSFNSPNFTPGSMLRGVVCLMVISGNQFLVGCKSPTSSPKHLDREVSPTTAELRLQLADSRIDAAKAQMSSHRQDRAMALLISALGIHPESSEAITLVREILAKTRWNFPVKSIKHHFPIEHIALADSSSTAWVGLRGKSSTLVRWNLNESAVESILFPVADTEVRSLIISPVGNYLVVERGDSAVLCNARTLKPIRNLGKIPEAMTPASAITFSNDGLLVAHPVREEGKPTSIVWNIRDAATGELIRSSEARLPDASQALAAALNQTTLTVFHDDGSLMEFPVSPVETGKESPFSEPLKLNFADFSADGESVLALQNRGPHEPSEAIVISYHGAEDGTLTQENLWKRFSWSRHPNRWRNFAGAAESPMMIARDQSMLFSSGSLAPIHSAAEITAAAFDGHSIVSGDTAGNLTVHRLIPPPMVNAALGSTSNGRANVETLKSLAVAVGGIRFDETTRTFLEISVSDRLAEISKLNSEVLGRSFPGYNFAKFVEDLNALRFRKVQPEAMLPVWDRLAQSDYQGNSWKSLLDATADLASSPWRKSLVEAEEKRANLNGSHQGKSHFIGEFALDEAGRENDSSEFLTAIGALPGEGPAIAHALSRALVSENSAWINACLAGRNPPNLIFQIARSRIAWLEGRKADALAPWSENFPSLDQARLHQDWNGWEQADFTPALELIRSYVDTELTALDLTDESTPEQRRAVAVRLEDPVTIQTIGKRRYAIACMRAALAFSAHKEEAEMTFKLANLARTLGAPAEPCLRAEAVSLTATGDFQRAHPLWIELITEHPLENQMPGDYAEAAYTAFENGDASQAMTILTTGIHRYPKDANYALRAGWIALLTGNSQRSYELLQIGNRVGFPDDKLENATALMTIAAAQNGAHDDASVHFNDLLRIDSAWSDPATLDALDWPEELKSFLREFMQE